MRILLDRRLRTHSQRHFTDGTQLLIVGSLKPRLDSRHANNLSTGATLEEARLLLWVGALARLDVN